MVMMTSSNGNIFHVTGHLYGIIHRSPVNSPHKGQWRRALMFILICARINGWVNNCEAGDLRRKRAHYDVVVMWSSARCQAIIWTNDDSLKMEHREKLSALLQLHLHSPLNTWLQHIAQTQLQVKTRDIYVVGFGASYIREFTVLVITVLDMKTRPPD